VAALVFEYDARNHVLAVRFEAIVTAEVLASFLEKAATLITRYDVRAALIDLTDVDTFSLTPEATRQLARRPEVLPDPARRVVVAPKPMGFGIARMFKVATDGRDELHVVRSTPEAYRILEIRDPRFEPVTATDVS
jgi:hypothetical protein